MSEVEPATSWGDISVADLLKRDKGRNVWQARLDIPARVQHAFLNAKGQPKRTLVKSLGTADKVEAKKRAALVISRWRRLFEKAGLGDDPLREEAERWRAWLASTSTGDEDDITPTLLGERAEEIEQRHGEKAAQLFHRAATGQAVFLDAVADRWLAWRAYPPRAEQAHRYHLKLLMERHQEVGQVDPKGGQPVRGRSHTGSGCVDHRQRPPSYTQLEVDET